MSNINEEYKDYVRGFIEAAIDFEGSLSLEMFERPDRKTIEWIPLLQVGNINLEILMVLQEMTGVGNINEEKYLTRINKKWRRFWRWRVRGEGLRILLPKIGLIIKEEQRKLILKVLSILPGCSGYRLTYDDMKRLEEIYFEMKELNRKGRNTLEQELNL